MKRYFILALAIAMVISTTACSSKDKAVLERIKPVKTVEVKEQDSPAILSYSGIVDSSELKKLAFKSTGRIGKIHVEVGQNVKKGDMLVELEGQDLQYALAAAKGQMGAAQSIYEKAMKGAAPEELRNAELNVKKAQDAYDYVMTNYKRVEALYNSGAISKNELEKVKLEADVKDSELKQAKELLSQVKNGARSEDKKALLNQLEQAKADYEYKASMVKDAVMIADGDGYIVDILYEKGELVPAGYPVAVVRNESLVVNVGLAEKDFSRVMLGTTAKISTGEKTIEGRVTNIAQVPDAQSRTYNIEITIDENSLNLGAVAKVEIVTGNERGIWIPLTSMLSDGMDYVYLAKDNIAEKREIVIEDIAGSMAKVGGLTPGEQLVVEGMKRLRAGDGISILK
ncbi:MAG: efflux RND transporter periplasmic adaptor subunit [Clostridiaceae bacterium]|nr:efflux RND transporter periplasmic adaptor subunit [Clostridiaceae bacterium]